MSQFDIQSCRNEFPALRSTATPQVYFDNAGGSQTPIGVVNAIHEYLAETNVQMGATYPVALKSTDKYSAGIEAAAKFINAGRSEVVIGASSSQLLHNLSTALILPVGSEVILSNLDHEANIAPWVRIAKARQLEIKWWTCEDQYNPILTVSSLKKLLSPKTRLVTCTHTSNIMGTIHDIKSIAAAVHEVKDAMLMVDGVAYAPHRGVDVKDLGVDFYVFSWYKVYGPHISMLYANSNIHSQVQSLAHYFNPSNTLEYKLGLAASSYELVASIPAIVSYFGQNPAQAWKDISVHEGNLQRILLDYLKSRPDITIYGMQTADPTKRLPIISFKVRDRSSKDIVEAAEKIDNRFGFRWGHFYSKRCMNDVMKINDDAGLVRVSMVHYNTEMEVKEFITVLGKVLDKVSAKL